MHKNKETQEKKGLKLSKENLYILAKELALNYFDASSLEFYPKQIDDINQKKEVIKLRNSVFENSIWRIKGRGRTVIEPHRNVLVIGAGCTYNAFKSIPLAMDAPSEIQKKIKIHDTEIDNFKDYIDTNSKSEILEAKLNPDYKYNVLDEIVEKYYSENDKLKLHSTSHKNEKTIDFETSLNLLARVFNISTVRELIHKLYNFKHGPTLFYQIVAHLFKNRFIDVIINFNFDEFLDQAIEDELGNDGYDLVLSDGDCKPIKKLSYGGRLRQPLYIKPHGTASHKSSMRFTKNQYYEMPTDMRRLLEELISSESEESKKKINLITVGYNMGSFEFNEILKTKLPEKSQIFSFYHFETLPENIEETIDAKKDDIVNAINKVVDKSQIFLIGSEFFSNCNFKVGNESIEIESSNTTLGNSFLILNNMIKSFFKEKYKPKGIYRHLLIVDIFGNENFWQYLNKKNGNENENSDNKWKNYPKDYFETAKYFKDRTIIEILINLAVNNGRINRPLLMNGITGVYYSKYYHHVKEDKKEGNDPFTVEELLESIDVNNTNNYKGEPLEIKNFRFNKSGNFESILNSIFDNKYLSDEFLGFFKNENPYKIKVKECLKKIKDSDNTRINSKLRSSIHHVFQNYNTTDLICTDLSNDLHFSKTLREGKVDTICMIADYGHQLIKFLDEIIDKKIKVYIILVDYIGKDKDKDKGEGNGEKLKNDFMGKLLKKDYSKKEIEELIQVLFLPIKKHNHHMTLFLNQNIEEFVYKKGTSTKAIYYYKPGLTQRINPIRMTEPKNIIYLMKKFEDYSKRGGIEDKNIDFDWITKKASWNFLRD